MYTKKTQVVKNWLDKILKVTYHPYSIDLDAHSCFFFAPVTEVWKRKLKESTEKIDLRLLHENKDENCVQYVFSSN